MVCGRPIVSKAKLTWTAALDAIFLRAVRFRDLSAAADLVSVPSIFIISLWRLIRT